MMRKFDRAFESSHDISHCGLGGAQDRSELGKTPNAADKIRKCKRLGTMLCYIHDSSIISWSATYDILCPGVRWDGGAQPGDRLS